MPKLARHTSLSASLMMPSPLPSAPSNGVTVLALGTPPHVVVGLINGAVAIVVAEQEVEAEAVIFDFADRCRPVNVRPFSPQRKRAAVGAFAAFAGTVICRSYVPGLRSASPPRFVPFNVQLSRSALVEVAVVVEIHPTGQQATDAGHRDPQRIDAGLQDAAIAHDDVRHRRCRRSGLRRWQAVVGMPSTSPSTLGPKWKPGTTK